MHECQKKNIIVNFVIQKSTNKHISLKKYTDWAILGHVTQNLEFWFQCRKCAPKSFSIKPKSWIPKLGHRSAICWNYPGHLESTARNLWFLFLLALVLSSRQLFKVKTSLFEWKHISLKWWSFHPIPISERKTMSFNDMRVREREEKGTTNSASRRSKFSFYNHTTGQWKEVLAKATRLTIQSWLSISV